MAVCFFVSSLAGVFSVVALPAMAQTMLPADTSTLTRDPAAIHALTTALNGLGGRTAWQSVHGASIAGVATFATMGASGPTTVSNPITWVDDWSTGGSRYARTTTTPGGPRTHKSDGSASFTTTFRGKSISVPRQDTTTVLLTHLPGAALATELSNSNYGMQVMPQSTDSANAGNTTIRVTKSDRRTIQEWTIATQTGALQSVRFTIPDALNAAHQVWETITYKHFTSYGGLLVPDSCTLLQPNRQTISFQFNSLAINPSVQDSDFSKGGAQ